jgi:hypothetical protein
VRDVAGVVPAGVERRGRLGRLAPVAFHHVRPAHEDFAGRADGHVAPRLVDDPQVAMQRRLSHRAWMPRRVVDPLVGGDRAGLGRAVDLEQRHAPVEVAADEGLADDRRAGGDRAQP